MALGESGHFFASSTMHKAATQAGERITKDAALARAMRKLVDLLEAFSPSATILGALTRPGIDGPFGWVGGKIGQEFDGQRIRESRDCPGRESCFFYEDPGSRKCTDRQIHLPNDGSMGLGWFTYTWTVDFYGI